MPLTLYFFYSLRGGQYTSPQPCKAEQQRLLAPLEDALYLSDIASKVYLIHRRSEFKGEGATVNRLKEKNNVEFILKHNVTKLNSDGKLESIEVTDIDGATKTIDVDGLFVAVGRIPNNQAFADLVKLDDAGYIEAGEECHTNIEGVFVAGDNRTKNMRQLVTATSDGAIAAGEAVKYISNLS